jgi:hypothetical protein
LCSPRSFLFFPESSIPVECLSSMLMSFIALSCFSTSSLESTVHSNPNKGVCLVSYHSTLRLRSSWMRQGDVRSSDLHCWPSSVLAVSSITRSRTAVGICFSPPGRADLQHKQARSSMSAHDHSLSTRTSLIPPSPPFFRLPMLQEGCSRDLVQHLLPL